MTEQETGLYPKALAAIEKYRMLRPGDRVAVGVSGGADSVALLDLLCRLEGLELTVCHLNHGLRPEAGEEEAFVRRLAEDRGLAFVSRRVQPMRGRTMFPRTGGMPRSPRRPVPRARFSSTVSMLSERVWAVAILPLSPAISRKKR